MQQLDTELTVAQILDLDNLVEYITEDDANKIAGRVVTDYENDKSSRDHREDKMKDAMDMALQVVKEKSFPWTNAANVTFPLITRASIRFADRAYSALVSDGRVARGKVLGDDSGLYDIKNPNPDGSPREVVPEGAKKKRADRIAKHLSYQFLIDEEEWEEDTDRLLMALPVVGCMFRKRYYDPELERCSSELVYPANLVVNYNTQSLDIAPRITEEIEIYPYQIQEKILSDSYIDFEYGTASAKAAEQGAETPTQSDPDAAHLFLHQLRREDLDGDGYPEPYICVVHKDTNTLVRMVANYRKDKIKYKGNRVRSIKPETYYVKYGLIPSPDGGFYDIGFGEILLPLNKTINSTINQMLDAGTMATAGGGFIGRGLRMKAGTIRIRPNEYQPVDTRGLSLKDNVVDFNRQPPSPVMFELLGLLINSGEEIAATTEILSGDISAQLSGVGIMQLVEQGMTAFKGIFKRLHRSIGKELKIQYRLNSIYLNDKEYFRFMDSEESVARKDYNDKDLDVMPVSDPSKVTDLQKMAEAQFLMGFKGDPLIDQVKLNRRIFETARVDDEGLILEQEPQPTPQQVQAIQKQILDEVAKKEIALQDETKRLEIASKEGIEEDKRKLEERKLINESERNNAELIKVASNLIVQLDKNKENVGGVTQELLDISADKNQSADEKNAQLEDMIARLASALAASGGIEEVEAAKMTKTKSEYMEETISKLGDVLSKVNEQSEEIKEALIKMGAPRVVITDAEGNVRGTKPDTEGLLNA